MLSETLMLNLAGIPHICISICCTWWRHQMETFSALLALCAGNSSVTGEFPSQGPVTRSFAVIFDLCLTKRLSKNREAGDLRRHRVHYDITVMTISWRRREMETLFLASVGGESTGHRWIPSQWASNTELWCFLWCSYDQAVEQTFELLVMWDTMTLTTVLASR